MARSRISSQNHYAPCVYLKAFGHSTGRRLHVYRTLVSRPEVPLWKESSIRSVGYLVHLYTRIAGGSDTDEFERWFADNYDTPVAEPLRKVISEDRLRPSDWERLIRFLAAQIVRTPAFFVKNLPRWRSELPSVLESTLQAVVRDLSAASAGDGHFPRQRSTDTDTLIPLRVTKKSKPDGELGELGISTVVGRGLWLFSIKRILTGKGAGILHEHKWTIVEPSPGLTWFTSDSPVVLLNFHGSGKYDFSGGTGADGSEILFPLSPRHLMYTQVGQSPPKRGSRLSRDKTALIRRILAEHAHRYIYACSQDDDIPVLRPRRVSEEEYRYEQEHWRTWHANQTQAERELFSTDPAAGGAD